MASFWDSYYENGIIPNIWKGITGQKSADRNNDENIEFQRESNAIEDARYAEETAYNRAFAEEQRDYERQLQQDIFAREDTAFSRQAEDLARVGINPLSQNLNGAGAGQAVTATTAPTMSARGGTALHKEQYAVNATGAILGLADTLNGLQTGKYNRDALALQNDKQFLQNLDYANQLGIDYRGIFSPDRFGGYRKYAKKYQMDFTSPDGQSLYDNDLFKRAGYSLYNKQFKDSVPNWQYILSEMGNDSVYHQAEKAVTKVASLFDKIASNIFEQYNENYNPLNFMLKLFQ